MSPLTPWHYILIASLAILFVLGTILALRSRSKFSVFITITLILALVGTFLWYLINETVYKVEVFQLEDERMYQTEQILIRGVVRNVGKYPVANVVATVKMVNIRGSKEQKATQFAQPTVFAELFEGDNPDFKRQNIVEQQVIADYINPGSAKTFRILMDYPPYFKNTSYDVTAKAD